MNADFILALEQLEKEKGISKELLLETIETALISAYKRHFGITQNARVTINSETGEIHVYAAKEVVDDVFDDTFEISLEDARKINIAYELGDTVEIEVTPKSFGRIAAQTAKQVVVQRIREAERGALYEAYQEKQDEVVSAIIHRVDHGNVYLELDKAEGFMPAVETIRGEKYIVNDRKKVYIVEVKKTSKGPQIIASRRHPGLVRRLFELEVPEIFQNVVQIKSIAREAGQRTKIAVWSDDMNVDAVGACVGPRGIRIESVVRELGGEKIDVIPYSHNPAEFIANALRPSKVVIVQVNEEEKAAKVIVPDYQLSLAIGKEGQNARLAAKLTGWKIDIKSQSQVEEGLFGAEGNNIPAQEASMPPIPPLPEDLRMEPGEYEASSMPPIPPLPEDLLMDDMELDDLSLNGAEDLGMFVENDIPQEDGPDQTEESES